MPTAEIRRDPEDGKVYTFEEMSAFYSSQKYDKKAIRTYWNTCKVIATPKAKAKAEATPKPAPKARQEKAVYREKKVKLEDMPQEGLCVCGEALIDMLPCSSADGNPAFRHVFGGSPFNCCIAAQRLGLPVSFLGGLSTDLFGEKLRGHLRSEGVDLQLAPSFPNPTTLAFVSREEGKGEQYAFFKENAADRSITKGIVAKAMYQKRFRAVHMSLGAVTLEDQKCAEAFQTFFNIAAKHGALRCFDPNIRANMIKQSGAKYSKLVEKLLRSVDLSKTSEEDVEYMYGEGANLETIASKWLKLGPKLVVFTLGSKGCIAYAQGEGTELITKTMTLPDQCSGGKTLDGDGKVAPVADTVGAGDTFMGGLITGCLGSADSTLLPQLVQKQPFTSKEAELIEDVLKLAVTTAAINCSRTGANPPTRAEVEKVIGGNGFKNLKL